MYQTPKSKFDDENQCREYIFNDFTAGAYQEFDVIKINRYGAKKERALGIDRYHIYNDFRKNEKNSKPQILFLLKLFLLYF